MQGDAVRKFELLEAIARRTGNAVIVTDAAGIVDWVNVGFERLTGYTLDEVRGKRPGDVLQGADTDPAVRAHMAAAIARAAPFDAEVLNYRKDGHQYWVRIEAEPTLDEERRVTGYMAVETDVTEARITATWEILSRRVGDALLRCRSVEEAASAVVEALVSASDVRAASAWVVERGNPHLRYVTGAGADAEAVEWTEVNAARTFARGTDWVVGVGAPGVAWGTGAPCKKTDFWEKDARGQYSRRAAAAWRAGIRTVCAVPVLGPEGVLAVLEFGGSHAYPGHERLPALLEHVAHQFGAFIGQVRSQRAFEALFRHSPDALLVVDATGAVMDGNARADALFGAVRGCRLETLLEEGMSLVRDHTPGDTARERRGVRADGSPFVASITVSRASVTGAPHDLVAVRDLTERLREEDVLRRSLAEKVTLVQEVHHRVKNNLQVLSSLASLQADSVDDPRVRSALDDTVHRIQSMALVHQQLYARDDLARVAFDDYARELCGALRASLAPDATLTLDMEPVTLPVDRAVPAGLILNELVTNAFKYGRSADGRVRVRVEVHAADAGFVFAVHDEGPGLPKDGARPGSMGATLIAALSRQLRARRTEVPTNGSGTSLRIEVPSRG